MATPNLFGDEYEMLNSALEAADMAWWFMELPSGAINTSHNKSRMLGYKKPDDFIHYKSYTDLLHPDDYERVMQAMRDHIDGKVDVYETDYRIKSASGKYVTFYDKGKIISRSNGEIIVAGIVMRVPQTSTLDI